MDQPQTQDNKTDIKKESNKALVITGIVIAVFVVALITNGFGLFNGKNNNPTPSFVALSIGESPVLGDINAPITVYEFSDFSCPYCGAAAGYNQPIMEQLKSRNPSWEPAIPKLKETYVKEGKVKIVFKYAQGHGTGRPAHIVGLCLNEQNLFWEFHDKAFANQADVNNINKMKDLAKELGANTSLLEQCISSNKYNDVLNNDDAMASSNGVTGTPSFLINGKLVEGAVSWQDMDARIKKELELIG